ncbi:hypothetical protein [Streptomyces noursei]|uniref:hypothetical protein n=1 Tax=Streptomyces noursei TaxID=1971 RepID=UPI001679F270|nr:hypothetical protein [Streptomyces noursei]MCZ1015612.1 hypothetical protein [Streptomyces noursei]GGW89460.1 hypothetical protein GCM10010341_07850 [Streptomyces noursei]
MAATKTKTAAKQAETEAAPTTFEHRGIEFTIPHPLDMPIGLLECDDEIEAVKLILGHEQWEAYKATGATIRDFKELSEKLAEAQGFDDSGN